MPRAKKSLGQNFLIDSAVISQLVNYVNPDANDLFLEIGPGKGAITKELLNKSRCTHAVEMDNDLSKELKKLEKQELLEKVSVLRKESLNLRFQKSSGQLEKTARVRQVKRQIARLKTAITLKGKNNA